MKLSIVSVFTLIARIKADLRVAVSGLLRRYFTFIAPKLIWLQAYCSKVEGYDFQLAPTTHSNSGRLFLHHKRKIGLIMQ